MFVNGSKVYNKFNKKYKKHKKGYVILGPPGIGKSTFVRRQEGELKDWIDADDLFSKLGVKWHQNENNRDDFKLNYMRCDYMLEQSKLLGYRIIGALFWEYKADAVVMPPINVHREYAKSRPDLNKKKVDVLRKLFRDHAKKFKIPIFETIEDAIIYINKKK